MYSFAVSTIGVRWLAPEPNAWFFSERMTTFESQKDDYTVVFVGSSHYRSAIDPRLFDRLTAEAGRPARSFSFSMPGIRLPETDYVIRRIRALKPANLKWVVIEPWMIVQLNEFNLRKRRLIYYHDLLATLMALRCIHHQPEPKYGRLVHYQRHIQHFVYRQTNQGLALSLVGDFYQGDSPARTRLLQKVTSGLGYAKREGSGFNQAERIKYQKKIQELPSIFRKSTLEPELAKLLVIILREVEAMGARPIFLFAPSTATPYELILPDDAPATEIVRLDDIERYPELFALESRWDMGHTNHQGAQLATAAAAEEFLRISAGKDGR